MQKGSRLAKQIDEQNRYSQAMQRKYKYKDAIRKYVKDYCSYCENKNTSKCNIVRQIDNKARCIEFKRKKEK